MKRIHQEAFIAVPFVAAAAWYLLMMARLGILNGQLRLRPDLLVFGFGAIVFGIPAAAAITVAVALPTYLLMRRFGKINLLSAGAAGLLIGSLASLAAHLLETPFTMPPSLGPLVGLASSICWWLLARKPGGIWHDEAPQT